MNDYEPLDITKSYNVGADIRQSVQHNPPTGETLYRGIPFKLADELEKCFIAFGPELPGTAVISVPVCKSAHTVIFAHAVNGSHLEEGDALGRTVAVYTFVYSDGQSVEVPIRERFEVGVIPMPWGFFPFLSYQEQQDFMLPQHTGPLGETGVFQQEAGTGWPRDFYLWAWTNPRPEIEISQIKISRPRSDAKEASQADNLHDIHATLNKHGGLPLPTFYLGAITLGHVNENPLDLPAALPVMMSLSDEADVQSPFDLKVSVDRGVATYAYALPDQTNDEYLAAYHKGFGQEQNLDNSPAYAEIAATPSATVTVTKGEEEIGQVKWADIEQQGKVETPRITFEVCQTGRNWVHTTVLDNDTDKPVPCRIHLRSPSGIPYQPHGHHGHINANRTTWHIDVGGDLRLSQISYAYIDGKCQGWLPRGEVVVDVARGYEYEPLRKTVEIKPGQRELTLRLKRLRNMNTERYFSGDTHVHFLSTQGALTEAAAEDLDVVNLLMSQWGHLFTNAEEFTGRPAVSGDKETIVYATQENRQHILGHLSLLGLKEPVMPWCTDGPGEAEMGGNMEVTMSHWADACHAQGGTVVIPHLPNPNAEPAALIATGRADAVEMLISNPFFHVEYYRYLNGGYRLPLAGGTDKMDAGVPVGMYRTYAYIPPNEGFTYDNWLKALRSGNTFLSGGPLLSFTVNGEPIGSTLYLGKNGSVVEVECRATSIFPIHSLQIVIGGVVVASVDSAEGAAELNLNEKIRIDRSNWICARTGGPNYHDVVPHFDSWRRGICAHTSPVYVQVGEKYDVCSPATMHYMMTLVNGSLHHIRRAPQWRPGSITHHHHTHDHLEFLEGPMHEAAQAIHRKMHEHGIEH